MWAQSVETINKKRCDMAKELTFILAVLVASAAWAQPEPDFGAMMKAFAGAAQSQQSTNAPATVSPKALKEALPKAIPGFERVEAGAEKQGAFGMNTVIATGVYESGEKSIRIEITDLGGMGGLGAMAMMGWASSEVDKETRSGFERTTTYQGCKALESFDRESKSGEIQVFDGGRFSVKIEGSDLGSFEELAGVVNAVDLKALSTLKPEAPVVP
jgi:hypothetical protein